MTELASNEARELADKMMKEFSMDADPVDHVFDELRLNPDRDRDDLMNEVAMRFAFP